MSLIEEQKETSRQITRLTDVLQMDDPAYQDVDLEKDGIPAGTIKETLEAAQDYLNCLNEYINQIDAIRRGIVTQYDKKRNLAAKLVPFGPQPPSSQGRKPMR